MTRALSLAIVVVMTTFVFLNIIFTMYPMVTNHAMMVLFSSMTGGSTIGSTMMRTRKTSPTRKNSSSIATSAAGNIDNTTMTNQISSNEVQEQSTLPTITSTTKNTAAARDILHDTVVMNTTTATNENGDEPKISPAVENDIASTKHIYNAISDEDGVIDGMNVTITNTSPREYNHTEGAQQTDIAGDTNTTIMDELLSGTNEKDDTNFTNGTHKDHNDVQTFQNSQKWLDGPRFGNIHESRMTKDFVKKLIFDTPALSLLTLNDSEHLLNLSICPSDSNFVNSQPSNEPKRYIASMTMRLM